MKGEGNEPWRDGAGGEGHTLNLRPFKRAEEPEAEEHEEEQIAAEETAEGVLEEILKRVGIFHGLHLRVDHRFNVNHRGQSLVGSVSQIHWLSRRSGRSCLGFVARCSRKCDHHQIDRWQNAFHNLFHVLFMFFFDVIIPVFVKLGANIDAKYVKLPKWHCFLAHFNTSTVPLNGCLRFTCYC